MAATIGPLSQHDGAETPDRSRSLSGTVSIVTGASRGIGAAIAFELAACGSHVVIDYLDQESAAGQVLREIVDGGGSAECLSCNVSDGACVRSMVEAVISRHGKVDILVNNAGILRDKSFLKMSNSDWQEVLNVNLTGVMLTSQAVLPNMIARNHGRIVNISSFVAQAGNFGQANYAAAKAGIIGFTRALALEVAHRGVTVNAVCPGFIGTAMWESIPDAVRAKILERIPMRRVGTPQEVARAVRFLAAEGHYITGQTLNINGGVFIG